MNQPHDPNQPQWGQPPTGGQPAQPPTGGQPAQPQWGAPTGQPYGQPGYGQQPGFGPQGAQPWAQPPAKGGNGKLIGLIVGGVVLLAAIGVTLWLVLGGGGGRSVEETIDGYVAAAKANDKEEAKKYTCPKIDAEIDSSGGESGYGVDFDIDVNSVEENGDKATAKVTATFMGESADATVELDKNSDDDWEICDIQIDFGGPTAPSVSN